MESWTSGGNFSYFIPPNSSPEYSAKSGNLFFKNCHDLIKHNKKDTKSADIINILEVLKQITTQNYY